MNMDWVSLEFLMASGIGVVTAAGVYLILRGRTFPVIIGLSLIGYAINVLLFATGRLWTNAPAILIGGQQVADPIPQALVLTAIVIGFWAFGSSSSPCFRYSSLP